MFDRYWGKIRSVAGQGGLLQAVKKISMGSAAVVRYPKTADVLFVSSGAVGDSWRYRVRNAAEELALHGISSSIAVQENIWLPFCADRFGIFIFHRASYSPRIARLVERIKKSGKEIIFETDDLLFDPAFISQQDFFKNSNEQEKKFFKNGLGGEILADPYVRTCTTTTSFLAGKLREKGKQVFVVPNNLSKRDIEIANSVLGSGKAAAGETVKIGYFSGGHSHDKDFATVTEALARIMEKYPSVELFLAGPLDIGNALGIFSGRIRQIRYAPREKHFANLASTDINIAPLEIGNPFCEAKSELKFFEAGIVKVPTVAAATQTFREAIADGVDGFVASSTDEWFVKLEKLVVDKNLRAAMGEEARQKALEKYSIENSGNEEYYRYLKSKIVNYHK